MIVNTVSTACCNDELLTQKGMGEKDDNSDFKVGL